MQPKKTAIIALIFLLISGYLTLSEAQYAGFSGVAYASTSEGEASSGEAEGQVDTTVFIELDPMTLPIIDEHGVNQTITLVVTIEAPDEENGNKVKHMAPRLTDAYIQDMYGVLSRKSSMEGGILKVSLIKERLNKVSRKVLGQNGCTDVLLQVVQQHSFY